MNLKYARMQSGKRPSTVAIESGISKQRYYIIEKTNKISSTNEFTARQIADSLGVNLFDVCDAGVLKFMPKTADEKAKLLKVIEKIEVE